jgi:hypothetical protein
MVFLWGLRHFNNVCILFLFVRFQKDEKEKNGNNVVSKINNQYTSIYIFIL